MFIPKIISLVFICVLLSCSNLTSRNDNSALLRQTDKTELIIKIKRVGVYGQSPVYNLTIHPDGKVLFEGIEHTKTKGTTESNLSEEKIDQLINEVNNADFFLLKSSYTSVVDNCPNYAPDQPTINISIKMRGTEKTINHYLGCIENGRDWKVFPQQLYNLENKIDEIAETKRWIGESK